MSFSGCCDIVKLVVGQGEVQFVSYEEFVVCFTLEFRESPVADGVVTYCASVRVCGIVFSINLSIFSCAAVYTCVIFVMSLDTLFVKFFNSCVIMLNCSRITMD